MNNDTNNELGPQSQNEQQLAEALQEDTTIGYRPVLPLEALWLSGTDMPQMTLRRDLEFMQLHPIVMTALDYYRSGISGAEFWGGPDFANPDNEQGRPISNDERVTQFVLMHVHRFWQYGVPLLQDGGYPYGWGAGEHIYKEVDGMLVWSHMKDFHPNDSFLITMDFDPIGIRIKNIRNKQPVNLWFASERVPAKAAWYPHRPRFNNLYGRSQLLGAWRPWRRLGWRDATEQVIDAAIYRAGYRGPIVRHPMEDAQTAQVGIPATQADGSGRSRRSARDVARQMVEWAKAGAGFTISSAMYPQSQGGGKKWEIEWPDHVMDVRPLIEAARYLEDQIMLGIGVPPELVRAGGTGSGYSGRSIPREAFLTGQQSIANAMLEIFIDQVVRPLVLWNFGEVPFQIYCKSLLKSQVEEKQAGQQQQSEDARKPGKAKANEAPQPNTPQAPQEQQNPAQVSKAMSVEQSTDKAVSVIQQVSGRLQDKVANIVGKIMRRAS